MSQSQSTSEPKPPIPPDQFMGEDADIVHHQSIRKRRQIADQPGQLNITPMIDVIFQLLIYFVVTASFAVGEGVIISSAPKGSGPSDKMTFEKPRKLKVYIRSGGGMGTDYRIEIEGSGVNSDELTFKMLPQVLLGMQDNEANPNGIFKAKDPVMITPDGVVRWEHVVNAFNAAVAARYSDVRFGESRQ